MSTTSRAIEQIQDYINDYKIDLDNNTVQQLCQKLLDPMITYASIGLEKHFKINKNNFFNLIVYKGSGQLYDFLDAYYDDLDNICKYYISEGFSNVNIKYVKKFWRQPHYCLTFYI